MTIAGSSPEHVAALRENPKAQRIFVLLAKIRSGTITTEEQTEFDELTKGARELDPDVLVD